MAARYTQPQGGPFEVEWGDPLTEGLIFAAEGGQIIDAAGRLQQSALGTGVTLGVGPYGKQWNSTGAQSFAANSFTTRGQGAWYGLLGASQATWDITVYISAAMLGGASVLFDQWLNNQRWLLQQNGAGMVWVVAQDGVGTRNRTDPNGTVFPSAGWYRITGSWTGGTNSFMIVNGVYFSTSVGGSPAIIDTITSGDTLNLGAQVNGAFSAGRIWNRGLSIEQAFKVNANPFQLYKAPRGVLRAAAAGNPSLTGSVTDGADVFSSVASPIIAATSAKTDGADAMSAAVSPLTPVSGALADGADALISAAAPVVGASVARTDGADTLAASASPQIDLSSATTIDGADVLAAIITPVAAGLNLSGAITGGADTLTASVSPVISISASPAEGADALMAAAVPLIVLSAALNDGADALAGALQVVPLSYSLSGAIAEGADGFAAYAALPVDMSGALINSADLLRFTSAGQTEFGSPLIVTPTPRNWISSSEPRVWIASNPPRNWIARRDDT